MLSNFTPALLLPELNDLCERRASLADIKYRSSNLCMNFSSESAYDHLLHSIFSAGVVFSDLRSQAQNAFIEALLLHDLEI